MAIEIFKLFGSVMVDTDKANKSISKTTDQAEGLGKKFLGGITSAAKWGAGIATAAGGVAIGFAKLAENLEITGRKSKVIFGDMAKDVQDWSLENERTFGLGAGTIEGYVGSLADIVQGMGMAKDASFDFGKGAVMLGTQLGNWGNVGADQAINDIQSAITGSTKAVEKYGIKLNETVLNEYTRKEGLGDTFNKLTEAEKAQVRYAAILGSSQNAVDYWNEGNRSSSFYLKEMREQFVNVGEILGKFILPLFSRGAKEAANMAATFATFVGGIEGGVKKAITVFKETGEPINFIHTLFKEVFGIDIPDTVLYFIDNFIVGFKRLWSVLTSVFETVGKPIFETLKTILTTLYDNAAPIFEGLQEIFLVMTEVFQSAWENVGQPVFEAIMEVVTWVGELYEEYFPAMAQIFSDFVELARSYWDGVLKPVFDAIGVFIQTVLKPIWDVVFGAIKDTVKNTFDIIINLWTNTLKPILEGIIAFISGIFSGNWSQAWNGIMSVLKGLWEGVKTLLWSPIEWFIGKIAGVYESITAPFKKAADAVGNIWAGVKDMFKLPHFTFEGSMNPLKWFDDGLPKIGVEWYAKGGILNDATIFGMNGPNAMVGGEAGPEAVAPISTLMDYVREAVNEANEKGGFDYDALLSMIFEGFKQAIISTGMNSLGFYLDKEKFGEAIADASDKIDGKRMMLIERGLIL